MMLKRWEIKSLTDRSNERILQHLVWDYLEKYLDFEVYGRVTLPDNSEIDLVFVDSERNLIGGVEVKRKKNITNRDIKQINRYLDLEVFDDFKVFFESTEGSWLDKWKSSWRVENKSSLSNKSKSPEFVYSEVTPIENSPFYELSIYGSSHITTHKKFPRNRDFSYKSKNEIWFEHKIWKALRSEGKIVLPNVTLPFAGEGEVDLFVRSEQEILALEVKSPKGRITDEQIRKYESLRESDRDVPIIPAFVIPREKESEARNKLKEKNVELFPFKRYYRRITTLEDFTQSPEDFALERFENKD